jgi:AbrB family looped-hinge helix DNA binding protein
MSRITQKGQVTIPKEIRDQFNIKPNDIGLFKVKDGAIIFNVKRGTILDAHRKETNRGLDLKKARELMEKEVAANILKEME